MELYSNSWLLVQCMNMFSWSFSLANQLANPSVSMSVSISLNKHLPQTTLKISQVRFRTLTSLNSTLTLGLLQKLRIKHGKEPCLCSTYENFTSFRKLDFIFILYF